jgi:DNA-binding cell septation regulator SpoVG
MKIKKVEIVPIRPRDGLVDFASVVLNDAMFLGSIGIHKRLDGNGFRITYPTRKIGESNMAVFHPLDRELSKEIEQAIVSKAEKILKI